MAVKIVLLMLTILLCGCVSTVEDRSHTDELKYAVAYCLSKAYPNTEFSKDAQHIAGSLLQRGDEGLFVYEAIRNHVSDYRQSPYRSKQGRNLNIMQCLDLYDSEETIQVIEQTLLLNQHADLSSPTL